MTTAYALVGIDGEVHAVVTERQQLEDHLKNQEFDLGETIQEFEYNDEPITERGLAIAQKIQVLIKDVRKFHMNKQIGFYQIHVDDRIQMVYDAITEIDAPIERFAPSLDAELEAHGIIKEEQDASVRDRIPD